MILKALVYINAIISSSTMKHPKSGEIREERDYKAIKDKFTLL